MTRARFALLLLTLISASARAATQDVLDASLDICLAAKAAQTSAGMVRCTDDASQAWNTRLNAAYSELIRKLDPRSRALLGDAQRSWLGFRAADAAFASGPWRRGTGTLEQLIVANSRMEELRTRARTLEAYLHSLE